MSSDFHFLVPESFHKELVQIGTVVSEKSRLEFLYVHDLGPRSKNDINLQYSHTFIYSIRCLLPLTFRSLAAIVREKSTVFTFSYRKAYVTRFEGRYSVGNTAGKFVLLRRKNDFPIVYTMI